MVPLVIPLVPMVMAFGCQYCRQSKRVFNVLQMIPTLFINGTTGTNGITNGTIGNNIGTNGIIGKDRWNHWVNIECT